MKSRGDCEALGKRAGMSTHLTQRGVERQRFGDALKPSISLGVVIFAALDGEAKIIICAGWWSVFWQAELSAEKHDYGGAPDLAAWSGD